MRAQFGSPVCFFQMYQKILRNPLRFPPFFTDEYAYPQSLIEAMLERKVEDRLGSGPTDAEEIKEHPWFDELDWSKILRKEYTPEFIPPSKSATDTANFDDEFTTEMPQVRTVRPLGLSFCNCLFTMLRESQE